MFLEALLALSKGYIRVNAHVFLNMKDNKFLTLNRGYYTVARRYEFYARVARTISHE